MDPSTKATIVFHGKGEFEAQMARDALVGAGIPVLHIPSLSTGVFGVPQTTSVAVPEEFAESAVAALKEGGFDARITERAKGVGAFQEMLEQAWPGSVKIIMATIWGFLGLLFVMALWRSLRG